MPILTKKSAVGLIIGSGNVGSTISSTGLNVYISRDAGYVWHEVSFVFTFSISGSSMAGTSDRETGQAARTSRNNEHYFYSRG